MVNEMAEKILRAAGVQGPLLGQPVQDVKVPVIVGFLESRFSRAHELGVTLSLGGSGHIPLLSPKGAHAFVTVLGNLVDNALDAVSYATEQHIHLDIARAGAQLVFSLTDSGHGIAEEQQQAIFARGFSTKGTGRGIGLYMLLLTLEEMDGTVKIDSHPGHGSTFTVHIPLSSLTEAQGAQGGTRTGCHSHGRQNFSVPVGMMFAE